jgi:OOP family OmpA-OmpF porin
MEKNMHSMKAVLALGLTGLAAVSSSIAAPADEGWYGGIGIGQSRAKINDDRIRAGLPGVTSIEDDDTDTGFKLFAGWQFTRNFALEGGYFRLGEFGYTANTASGSQRGTAKFQGGNVDAVGILPITEKFAALGRIGVTYTQSKGTFSGVGVTGNTSPSKSEGNFKVGLGLQYALTPALGLRGEWERYRVNDTIGNKGDIDMLTVGLLWRFGAEKQAAPRAETPPPVLAAAPAPEPVLVIVPIVAKTEQYCSILDIQFEINQKSVQRESEEKINKVGIFMRKYPNTTAVIEGHTDEVGTAADNMKLSERRAESVVTYLVDHGGIARSRLKSVGYGETRPIGDNKTQEGQRLNRRINAVIACATDIEGIAAVPERITMAMEMEFDTNRSELRPQYRDELRKVVNFMKANPRVTASVEGHTSNQQGTAAQSMRLSQQRAQSVVNAMAEMGVDRMRLFAEGFGQTRRFAYNTSVEGRQENRRVNIILDLPKQ